MNIAVESALRPGADARAHGSVGNAASARQAWAAPGRLTVVVPVGPGDQLDPCLRAQLEQLPTGVRVCVVASPDIASDRADRGSSSANVDGPRWLRMSAPAGRALQQNAGATAASGGWLWFLHADARLTDDTLPALARFIAADVKALGYFDLRFLADGPALMRLNAMGAWLRSHWLGLPFGDQGFVVPHSVFTSLGGFDPTTLRGEDHQLVWRVRHAGLPVLPVGGSLYTSARRYTACGWGATTREHLGATLRQAWRYSRGGRQP